MITPESPRVEEALDESVEETAERDDAYDPVDEAGWESFPASDPPAWSEAARGYKSEPNDKE